MLRWLTVALLFGACGCTDKIDAKGQAGERYAMLFPKGPATPSLLALADGLTGPAPEAVFVVRSLDAMLGAERVTRLKAKPAVQAAMSAVKAQIGFDPLALIATDKPIVMVANPAGMVARVTFTEPGLRTFQADTEAMLAGGEPMDLNGFKGRMQPVEGGEICTLFKGKEALIVLGEGKGCTALKGYPQGDEAWRAGLERAPGPAAPFLTFYHGDTRIKGEPSGIAAIDALADMAGLDYEAGVIELSAPGDEIAVHYQARPVDGAKLSAAVDAARDAVPPIEAVPEGEPLIFQFLLPAVMRDGANLTAINQVLGVEILPAQWPADQLLPGLVSFNALGHGVAALGAFDEASRTTAIARINGERADFDDARAWKTRAGVCAEGPKHQLYCAASRARASGAVARARAASVPAGLLFYGYFNFERFNADPAKHGFPTEAIDFVKRVREGVLDARLKDGWLEMDIQVKGNGTPMWTQGLELLMGLLSGL